MPSHLHPRSTATSALFAGTLAVCFAVVAVPHVWPCPRPRKAYMDSEIILDADGKPIRRVRRVRKQDNNVEQEHTGANPTNLALSADGSVAKARSRQSSLEEEALLLQQLQAEDMALRKQAERRECPVPKPKGIIGRLMGFEEKKAVENDR